MAKKRVTSPVKGPLRKISRKKGVASAEAHPKPKTTSGPKLGVYGLRHPASKLTPGHRRALRTNIQAARSVAGQFNHKFIVFCIKHILTSGNLVLKKGNQWRLRNDIAEVGAGEPFTSLDACGEAMIAALQVQYSHPQAVGPSQANHKFIAFCVEQILTSGNLALQDGTQWRLREDIAGISAGEPFSSLDACADAMIAALQVQCSRQIKAA